MEGYQREIDAEPYAALEAAIITHGELPILVCGLGALFTFSVRTPSLSRTSMSFFQGRHLGLSLSSRCRRRRTRRSASRHGSIVILVSTFDCEKPRES